MVILILNISKCFLVEIANFQLNHYSLLICYLDLSKAQTFIIKFTNVSMIKSNILQREEEMGSYCLIGTNFQDRMLGKFCRPW